MWVCRAEAIANTLRSRAFKVSAATASAASVVSGTLFHLDVNCKYNFLEKTMPDKEIFATMMMLASLVAVFRTGHALVRYTDAAGYVQKLHACWFDSASTLVSFCRVSEASAEDIQAFQATLVRLVSLLSAMCLNSLQHRDRDGFLIDGTAHRLQLLCPEGFDDYTQAMFHEANSKVECVFHMVQTLVVESMRKKVMSIAPPILTRTFQELADGLQTYHEAKKLSEVPMPFGYILVTVLTLVSISIYVPCMMVVYVQGVLSAMVFTWGTVFLMWYLNLVAESLSNPFSKESRSLNPSGIQNLLNIQLVQLLRQAAAPCAGVRDNRVQTLVSRPRTSCPSSTLRAWSQNVQEVLSSSEGHALALEKYRTAAWEALGVTSLTPLSPCNANRPSVEDTSQVLAAAVTHVQQPGGVTSRQLQAGTTSVAGQQDGGNGGTFATELLHPGGGTPCFTKPSAASVVGLPEGGSGCAFVTQSHQPVDGTLRLLQDSTAGVSGQPEGGAGGVFAAQAHHSGGGIPQMPNAGAAQMRGHVQSSADTGSSCVSGSWLDVRVDRGTGLPHPCQVTHPCETDLAVGDATFRSQTLG